MANASLIEKYRATLARLFPQGKAWEEIRRDKDVEILKSMAIEYCRVDDRVQDLLREIDPNQAVELLDDWEALLGLPDECTPENQTTEERQQQAAQKYAALGGLSAEYYEKVAADLGYTVSVRDFKIARCGELRCNERLFTIASLDYDFRCGEDRLGKRLGRFGWQYYFIVEVQGTSADDFRCGANRCGDRLRDFEIPILRCTFAKLKPAHTGVFFQYV